MQKILCILRRRPLVQELVSPRAEKEANIDDVSLGTKKPGGPILLLQEFYTVCQESHVRIKLDKCEYMREVMEYLGFDIECGWWNPAAPKMQPLQDMQIRDDPRKWSSRRSQYYWRVQFVLVPYTQFAVSISSPD